MRRPVLGLAALFGLGCLLVDGEAGRSEALVLVGLAALLLGLALVASGGRQARAALGAAALALGTAAAIVEGLQLEAGGLWRLVQDGPAEGRPMRVVGVVRGDAVERAGRLTFLVDTEEAEVDGRVERCAGRIRVEVGGEWPKPRLLDGNRVAVWATLRAARRAEGVRESLAAFAYCKSARLLERRDPDGGGRARRWAAALREGARGVFTRSMLAGTERGLVRAMVLGDRSEVDETTAEAFRASGTYHVLALSGAQVALLAGLVVGGLRWFRASPWTQAAVTATAIGLYSLFVGGDVPVVRAALMASAVLAGRALELDADAANLLGAAALVVLADRPAAAADVGFQLSFGATLGILALAGPLTRGVPRMPLRVDLAVAASVAAQCALAPILAGWFHRLAPAAVAPEHRGGAALRRRAPRGPRGAARGAPRAGARTDRGRRRVGRGPRAPAVGRPRASRAVARPAGRRTDVPGRGAARGRPRSALPRPPARRAGSPARVPPGPRRGAALETGGREAPPGGDRRGPGRQPSPALPVRAQPPGRRGRLEGSPLRSRREARGPGAVASRVSTASTRSS